MKKYSFLVAFLVISTIVSAQDITQGTWFNQEKDAKIQLFKQGTKLFGKIVWIKEPLDNGKPRSDKNNPNAKLKTQPIIGLVFMKNFAFDGNKTWEGGELYDAKSGKTYSGKITVISPKELELRGFIGISLLGRTSHFTKAD